MRDVIRLVGPNQAVELFGVKLVGVNAENGKKLLFTVAFVAMVFLLRYLLRASVRLILRGRSSARVEFWCRQAIGLLTALQYTGRVVTVSNAKIFDEPVYNYTRDFPYLWEEMKVPIPYAADRERAERILLEAAGRHTVTLAGLTEDALGEMRRRYFLRPAEVTPRVYYRLTDNWLELTLRFVVEDRGIREAKDAMSRDILKALDEAGIGLASTTFEITGLPPLHIEKKSRNLAGHNPKTVALSS